jgi:hypothetical protein
MRVTVRPMTAAVADAVLRIYQAGMNTGLASNDTVLIERRSPTVYPC